MESLSILEPASFNILINGIDRDQVLHQQVANDTRLTQKKVKIPFKGADKIKKWAHENLMEFNKPSAPQSELSHTSI